MTRISSMTVARAAAGRSSRKTRQKTSGSKSAHRLVKVERAAAGSQTSVQLEESERSNPPSSNPPSSEVNPLGLVGSLRQKLANVLAPNVQQESQQVTSQQESQQVTTAETSGAVSSTDFASGDEVGAVADVLPAAVEAKLDAIPDAIGDDLNAAAITASESGKTAVAPASTGDEGDEAEVSADDIRELLDGVTFADEDVRDLLEEGFEALSEYFGSDHWKLTARQARMLSRPVAQLLNSLWARLCKFLPDLFARWCEELPGLAGVVMACALVIGPKAVKQWRLSRAAGVAGVAVKAAATVAAVEAPKPSRAFVPAVVAVGAGNGQVIPPGVH